MMILITGASGLLGANLAMNFRNLGDIVAVSGSHKTFFPVANNARVDLTNFEEIYSLVSYYKPDWIIHCAALTKVEWCEQYPNLAFQTNVFATHNIARLANMFRCSLIYISTDSVFDGKIGNYSERDRVDPQNVYARTKLYGEMIARYECPNALIVRTNIYGWNLQNKLSFAEWILSLLENKLTVSAFTDVFFNPLFVNDLGKCLMAMIEKKVPGGIYHLASSDFCSKHAFAIALAKTFNLDHNLIKESKLDNACLLAIRPRNTRLNTEKACAILSDVMPTVKEGLNNCKTCRENGYVDQLKSFLR